MQRCVGIVRFEYVDRQEPRLWRRGVLLNQFNGVAGLDVQARLVFGRVVDSEKESRRITRPGHLTFHIHLAPGRRGLLRHADARERLRVAPARSSQVVEAEIKWRALPGNVPFPDIAEAIACLA